MVSSPLNLYCTFLPDFFLSLNLRFASIYVENSKLFLVKESRERDRDLTIGVNHLINYFTNKCLKVSDSLCQRLSLSLFIFIEETKNGYKDERRGKEEWEWETRKRMMMIMRGEKKKRKQSIFILTIFTLLFLFRQILPHFPFLFIIIIPWKKSLSISISSLLVGLKDLSHSDQREEERERD